MFKNIHSNMVDYIKSIASEDFYNHFDKVLDSLSSDKREDLITFFIDLFVSTIETSNKARAKAITLEKFILLFLSYDL